jgi:hypothetical protein
VSPDTLYDHKIQITEHCFSLVHTEIRAATIKSKVHDGTDLTTSNLGSDNKMETMCIDAMQNDNAVNINTNTAALWIITVFP